MYVIILLLLYIVLKCILKRLLYELNQKKENIRLLGEQIILTKQLEAEREKMLEKGSQNT